MMTHDDTYPFHVLCVDCHTERPVDGLSRCWECHLKMCDDHPELVEPQEMVINGWKMVCVTAERWAVIQHKLEQLESLNQLE